MATAGGKITDYWSCPEQLLLDTLRCSLQGLGREEAGRRLKTGGPNALKTTVHTSGLLLLLRQFKSPVILILTGASVLSFFLGQRPDALIILVIIFASAMLGFFQERGATQALKRLLQLVQVKVPVVREGTEISIPLEEVVPGDIVLLNAGQTVPGDCRLLESKDLYANEASLTGETFPAEKKCGQVSANAGLHDKHNILFMGTHVISGTAKAIVIHTGADTEFGSISRHLRRLQPETEFERGIRRFGYLLMEVTLLLVIIIFSFNIFLHRPLLDSFLFSMAIAVGLTPQLLPAIISINLARGATSMAKQSVIVRRLSAIENFGSMNVLCADKTGTITRGEIVLHKAINPQDGPDKEVFRLAWLNAFFETGFSNPIDQAIKNFASPDITGVVKLDELPYDFIRRRLSILVADKGERMLITKGAFDQVVEVCSQAAGEDGRLAPMEEVRASLLGLYSRYSEEGFRVLAVAYKRPGPPEGQLKKEDEKEMVFAGLLLLTDPLKDGIPATLATLHGLGISVKIITGDNSLVAKHISGQAGLPDPVILTGPEIREMSTEALIRQAGSTMIFAAVEPNQKERILLALKKAGNVVGFM
ncbi:MAG TPA: HAD-IC family P-type ATPase, partial [Puia sp.]|nr:HAD-IC family P-type ATPase [Puia sp.]